MIIDKDTPLLGEQTFPDKFGRDKTYTLYYYQWQPSKNQIKLENPEKKRISLSYKQTLKNPWSDFVEKTPVGSILNTKIVNITDFGLFVSLENSELVGMIHHKDISWNESEKNLNKFKKNDTLKAKILEIDKEK